LVRGRLHTKAAKKTEKKLARCFRFTFRYIEDVLSLNNSRFGDFVDLIYPIELEMEDLHIWAQFKPYLRRSDCGGATGSDTVRMLDRK
jgi:hypothetical protein